MKRYMTALVALILILALSACGNAAYSITLDENGGRLSTGVSIRSAAIPKDLPTPEKKGFAFTGWFYDAEGTQSAKAGDKLKADTTLYAGWAAEGQQELVGPTEVMVASIFSETSLPFLIGSVVLAAAVVVILVTAKKKKQRS